MQSAVLTILIVQYKTLELTKLCLRSLKKYTNLDKIKVIVIDNNSQDASLDYLKSLNWIELIEVRPAPDTPPAVMHAQALDIGLASCTTPYVLSIHTDTIVINEGWLDFLLGEIEHSEKIGGVGSWKLEFVSQLKRLGKTIEDGVKKYIISPLFNKKNRIVGSADNFYYLRSHCALYRTDLIKKYTNGFNDGDTAGRSLHQKMMENGFEMKFIEPHILAKYIRHLNHATMILNPEISGKKTGSAKSRRRISQEMKSLSCLEILSDSSLD